MCHSFVFFISIVDLIAVLPNRMEKIVQSLKKCHINKTDPIVLSRIGQVDRFLEVGSVSTDLAVTIYKNVQAAAGSETKSCITTMTGLVLNGPVFDEFPFIFSAHDSHEIPKLVKILKVAEGVAALATRETDVEYEARSVQLKHPAIVPMELQEVNIDQEMALKANCRVGTVRVLVMPWYNSTLNKHPSHRLEWLGREGCRLPEALQFMHIEGFVHMDVKAMNFLVDSEAHWFLGDFGSCKPVGEPVTSCSVQFCFHDPRNKEAHPKYDYFMLLLMLLVEALVDRRCFRDLFYQPNSKHACTLLVAKHARSILNGDAPNEFKCLCHDVVNKLTEFDVLKL